jgi:hypothetical protein
LKNGPCDRNEWVELEDGTIVLTLCENEARLEVRTLEIACDDAAADEELGTAWEETELTGAELAGADEETAADEVGGAADDELETAAELELAWAEEVDSATEDEELMAALEVES